MKIEFSRQVFNKSPYTEFHENPSSWSRIFAADGRTDSKQTDMTKLKFAFLNFVKASTFTCVERALRTTTSTTTVLSPHTVLPFHYCS